MDPELIPALPEDITSLSDDELAELRTRLLDLEQKIYDADEETVGDASNAEVMAAYEQVVEAIRSLNTEQAKRGEEQQAVADKMTELRGDIRDDDEPAAEPEPEEDAVAEEEAEEVEGEVVEEPEPAIVASSRPFRSRKVVRDEQPEPDDNAGLSLVAASDVPGFSSGMPITALDLAQALIDKRRAFVSAPEGYREQVVVASSQSHYPEDRWIGDEDPLGDSKIRKAVGSPGNIKIDSLVAAGGICAPTDVRYAWDVLGSTSTPVWDSLPKFGAARGGVRFPVIPTIANITTATTTVTAAQDAAGGTSAVKGCQAVTCPSFSEVLDRHRRGLPRVPEPDRPHLPGDGRRLERAAGDRARPGDRVEDPDQHPGRQHGRQRHRGGYGDPDGLRRDRRPLPRAPAGRIAAAEQHAAWRRTRHSAR